MKRKSGNKTVDVLNEPNAQYEQDKNLSNAYAKMTAQAFLENQANNIVASNSVKVYTIVDLTTAQTELLDEIATHDEPADQLNILRQYLPNIIAMYKQLSLNPQLNVRNNFLQFSTQFLAITGLSAEARQYFSDQSQLLRVSLRSINPDEFSVQYKNLKNISNTLENHSKHFQDQIGAFNTAANHFANEHQTQRQLMIQSDVNRRQEATAIINEIRALVSLMSQLRTPHVPHNTSTHSGRSEQRKEEQTDRILGQIARIAESDTPLKQKEKALSELMQRNEEFIAALDPDNRQSVHESFEVATIIAEDIEKLHRLTPRESPIRSLQLISSPKIDEDVEEEEDSPPPRDPNEVIATIENSTGDEIMTRLQEVIDQSSKANNMEQVQKMLSYVNDVIKIRKNEPALVYHAESTKRFLEQKIDQLRGTSGSYKVVTAVSDVVSKLGTIGSAIKMSGYWAPRKQEAVINETKEMAKIIKKASEKEEPQEAIDLAIDIAEQEIENLRVLNRGDKRGARTSESYVKINSHLLDVEREIKSFSSKSPDAALNSALISLADEISEANFTLTKSNIQHVSDIIMPIAEKGNTTEIKEVEKILNALTHKISNHTPPQNIAKLTKMKNYVAEQLRKSTPERPDTQIPRGVPHGPSTKKGHGYSRKSIYQFLRS